MRETQLEGAQDFLDDCIYRMKIRKSKALPSLRNYAKERKAAPTEKGD